MALERGERALDGRCFRGPCSNAGTGVHVGSEADAHQL